MKKSSQSKNLHDKQSNFLLYTGNNGNVNVEVFLKDETVWLTQKAISELFGKERSVITKHLKNVFAGGELEEKSNVQKMHFSHSDKPIKFYNRCNQNLHGLDQLETCTGGQNFEIRCFHC